MSRSWRWHAVFAWLVVVVIGMMLRLCDAQPLGRAQSALNVTAFLDELARITDDNLGVGYMQVQLKNFGTCIYAGVMLSSKLPRRLQISQWYQIVASLMALFYFIFFCN